MSHEPLADEELEALRFPIGRFELPTSEPSEEERLDLVERIAAVPAALRSAVEHLDDEQVDTEYRPDGWTVRQVIHHLADSHMNSYIRFKLTVTEDHPTVGTYKEGLWGEHPDSKSGDIELSLTLLESLHKRWTDWLRTLTRDEWQRTLYHPEIGDMTLDQLLAMYAWHGDHHTAHITRLREREGW